MKAASKNGTKKIKNERRKKKRKKSVYIRGRRKRNSVPW